MITQEINHFNPHSHEGSDQGYRSSTIISQKFQSTLPRRERLNNSKHYYRVDEFQSTLPRRERPHMSDRHLIISTCISIHTPTKGATIISLLRAGIFQFQSTLPRRERLEAPCNNMVLFSYFNPHSHEGSDRANWLQEQINKISIHTPTKGATVVHF